MLVYDITNSKSFDNIAKWLRNIDEVSGMFFPWSFLNSKYVAIFQVKLGGILNQWSSFTWK